MKIQWIAMLAVLAGCSAETMGTAATGAQIKKQELQQQRASRSLEPE